MQCAFGRPSARNSDEERHYPDIKRGWSAIKSIVFANGDGDPSAAIPPDLGPARPACARRFHMVDRYQAASKSRFPAVHFLCRFCTISRQAAAGSAIDAQGPQPLGLM
jgi:hypothetical protein